MVDSKASRVLLNAFLQAVPGTEKLAMKSLEESLRGLALSVQRVEDLKTMIAEAALNAMEHGCEFDANKWYEVELLLLDVELVLKVRDTGRGCESNKIAFPSIDEMMVESGDARGWGLVMIDALADSWLLKRDGDVTEMEIRVSI